MNTTLKHLTALKRKHGGASDYRVAIILGISHQTISAWRNGRTQMNIETTTKVANELGLDPATVWAKVQLDGARTPASRQVWQAILNKLKNGETLVTIGLAAILHNTQLPIFLTI